MELDIYVPSKNEYLCHSIDLQKNLNPVIMSMEHCLFAILNKNKQTHLNRNILGNSVG